MTSGKEDYLKAIYIISENHDLVSNKELSDLLQVSPPSVSEMISKLQKEGYVDYTAYKGSKMTAKGRHEAGRLFRFHALWEVFLVDRLGFSWSEAHERADGLEHATTDLLAQRLDAYLGHPKYCPHGDPVPNKDGSRKGLTRRLLADLKIGESTHIRRVAEDYKLMDYIQSKHIDIGMTVKIKDKEPYEGPILLKSKEGEISLSFKAAQQIYVDDK
ncbi:MAG: metal-dependent transcriptional regulator [Dialister sp.]|nr:metal-dependent transcriptional regulator [Dialister sp.]